jgi:nitrile hydratase subunit beta
VPYTTHADLGGRPDFGPVVQDAEDSVFHAAWESRVLALSLAMGATGCWNIDMSRAARETLPAYLELSYYEIWLGGLEVLLVAKGLLTAEELAAGRAWHPSTPAVRILTADQVAARLAKGSPTERPSTDPARYRLGQRVVTRATPVDHHTRLPAYLRGRTGIIERIQGSHVFADSHAQGLGEDPQWLYTVVFEARELWGPLAAAGHRVSFDAWQSYLEPA